MTQAREIEVKYRVYDLAALDAALTTRGLVLSARYVRTTRRMPAIRSRLRPAQPAACPMGRNAMVGAVPLGMTPRLPPETLADGQQLVTSDDYRRAVFVQVNGLI